MAHRIVTVDVQGSPMEVFLFEPPGAGPHPGLVLCQHIPVGHTGLENDTFTLKAAERYAENGYAVAAPFIFHWWPKSADIQVKRDEFRDDWTTLDLRAAFDVLAGLERVDGGRIGIVGHCWGGRVAWLGAATDSRYRACAVFYGGRIKLPMGPGTPPAIELAPQIRCPVMGFFGNEDTNPPPADVDDYEAALAQAGVAHTFHRYEGAGHAFQSFNNPERYRHEASEDAWSKVLAFLGEALDASAAGKSAVSTSAATR
jgi:carboxymethylenebutenolidase